MRYWLMKTEAETYSIHDLKRDKVTPWEGVRNYAARNHMQQMAVGDAVFIYHSNTNAGIVGLGAVARRAHPDESQFNAKGEYYEPRATREKPVWFCVDIRFKNVFARELSLVEVKHDPKLVDMVLVKRSRLSVQPVSENHFKYIQQKLASS